MSAEKTPVIAFVFPGQGAQTVGMGKALCAQAPSAKAVFETFNAIVADDLTRVTFEGPEDTLRRTLYTQPAILATSLAALAAFQAVCPLQPAVTAGHSLGEYGALVAAGVLDWPTAARLIHKRASLMEAADQGAMAAVLGLGKPQVEAALKDLQTSETVVVANDNSPLQVVISGTPAGVAMAEAPLKAAGAKRVVSLPVGGAFHSPLMQPAAREFNAFLKDFTFGDAACPVITNVDAAPTTEGALLQEKLARQIDHGVQWTDTMAAMVNDLGVTVVIEFGPGKVLTGLIKKTHPGVTVFNVSDTESLDATLAGLKELPGCCNPQTPNACLV
ncbi:MAG: ACP S-malonyltransferase [Candidatus Melainabacteria bacterium]